MFIRCLSRLVRNPARVSVLWAVVWGLPGAPSSRPGWSCPTSIPGWACVHGPGQEWRCSLTEKAAPVLGRLFLSRVSLSGDACCERPGGGGPGAAQDPLLAAWEQLGANLPPEPTPTWLPSPRLTAAAGGPQRSARQAPPDPRNAEVWGVSLGPGGWLLRRVRGTDIQVKSCTPFLAHRSRRIFIFIFFCVWFDNIFFRMFAFMFKKVMDKLIYFVITSLLGFCVQLGLGLYKLNGVPF